ncbi:TetR/AcrR family transcriptional regulator [Vibrio methylphosphonaticus]|uniref:TetR/AcrR family transcriptional regulator n=1 Tax=Vibrio methylphosphonaticus TaxID=2946866 RepID=UPI00202A50A3|nr:TetR/AcrR family transcriptional regulator [Vibrio methylphosphonaticus]MCL9775626.1 TetR family transcriptional regulator [Vibrio methylphosphonaticus]
MEYKTETRDKILDVAETLFTEHGYKGTSLRTLTSKAKVNVASVNYHFGDKKSLIRQLLNRYLSELMPAIQDSLERLNQQEHYTLEDVFKAIKGPLCSLNSIKPNGMNRFLLLLSKGYSDIQGHLRWFILTRYKNTLDLFVASVRASCGEIDDAELFWRLHFSLGTFIFAIGSSKALTEIASSTFNQHNADAEAIIDRLIPYLAAGIVAQPSATLSAPTPAT